MVPFRHASFYRFVPLPDPEAVAEQLRAWGPQGLTGNITVAAEGLSAAVAAPTEVLAAFEVALTAGFDGAFAGLHFKHNDCARLPFTLLKVHVKPEIVAFGVEGVSGLQDGPDTHVSPQQWRALLDDPNTVVIDNRNSFEWKLGRFRGAIDPGVAHFRDFPAYVEAHREAWAGKTVAMYCTGGIRCEKTAAWMQAQGLKVAQLDGGILNFFELMPDAAADWLGECYVFDKRIAIDPTHQQPTGTTPDDVFTDAADHWRLARARRLDPG